MTRQRFDAVLELVGKTATRIEIPFADEHELEELAEALDRAAERS